MVKHVYKHLNLNGRNMQLLIVIFEKVNSTYSSARARGEKFLQEYKLNHVSEKEFVRAPGVGDV